MRAGDEAHRRAAELLASHLTDAQRREYEREGAVTIERRGPVATLVVRQVCAVALAAIAAAALPLARTPALLVLVLLPVLTPSFAIACLPRRRWRIDPEQGPQLVWRRVRVGFCVSIDAELPAADRVLAYKNVLQGNEAHFLRKANILWPRAIGAAARIAC